MDTFDYKAYLKNNPLLKEELEDNGPEEKAFDNEFDALGAQLATAIKGELKGKEEKLDEVAGVVGIIVNIFNEILWPQFVHLKEVRNLPLNEQVNRYNQYLNELQNRRQHYTQQLNWLEGNRGGIKPEQPVQDLGFLLQEDGFNILQEDNNKIIIT